MATTAAPIPEKSIAVLPFTNMTANAENGFFADGVQDEILSNLSKIADLKVISRTSVNQYRGAKQDMKEIGRQLGVAHLLEGSVQRANDRVRVTAQLVDARTDTSQWSEHYDRDLADVFAIQSEIARTIASHLQAKLSPAEKAAIEQPLTTNVQAFDLFTRARAQIDTVTFNTRAKSDLTEAVQLLDKAVELDSGFLQAYCQMANAHGILYLLGYDHTPQRLALADAAVQNALRIAPDSGDAHYARAENLYRCHLDYDGALAELAIAQKSLPNDPRVYLLRGFIDRRQGSNEDGLQNMARALKLDPRNLYTLHQISLSYELLHRYADYAETLERALAIAPDDLDTKAERGAVELKWRGDPAPLHAVIDSILANKPAQASTVADKWIDLALSERDANAARGAVAALGDNTFGQDAIRLNYHVANGLIARMEGDQAAATAAFTAARERQARLLEPQPDYAPGLVVLALIDAGLDRKEDALRESQRAIELLPRKKDSINAPLVQAYAAIVAAWCGEKELAIERLTQSLKLPSKVHYGQLKLHPYWDPLRGDPRFEKIVASLAPNGKA
jgi:TolB-like protein